MPMSVFYSLAYGTAYKAIQPSRMPVMQIEFCISAVGYFCFYLGFARSSSLSSSVQYGHLFIMIREVSILAKKDMNKIVKID